jgi:hypothetical protein
MLEVAAADADAVVSGLLADTTTVRINRLRCIIS